jgi:hypothetical protein
MKNPRSEKVLSMEIGKTVGDLRKSPGMILKQPSDKAAVSLGLLSAIE